jgi:hypothetical protein
MYAALAFGGGDGSGDLGPFSFTLLPLYYVSVARDNNWMWGVVEPVTHLGALWKRKVFCPYEESNRDSSVVQSIALLLYGLSYSVSAFLIL